MVRGISPSRSQVFSELIAHWKLDELTQNSHPDFFELMNAALFLRAIYSADFRLEIASLTKPWKVCGTRDT
jgi:hypothetical protein